MFSYYNTINNGVNH